MKGFQISKDLSLPLESATWTFAVLAIKGAGKALWIETPIPTVSGWKTMRDISVGDILFDERGHPCRVRYVTDVQYNRHCFRVTFDDGAFLVTDEEHLWVSYPLAYRMALGQRKKNPDVRWYNRPQCRPRLSPIQVTTKRMRQTLKVRYGKTFLGNNHAIPCTAPLDLPDRPLLIDPYTLGAWLGDGNSTSPHITTMENAILTGIGSAGYTIREVTSQRQGATSLYHIGPYETGEGLRSTLINKELLGNKHVPQEFLRSSIEQRLRLLQGLMDTDGYISTSSNYCYYYSTNQKLAESVQELIVSLGWKARWREKRSILNGRDVGVCYEVGFRPTRLVFTVQRKANRLSLQVSQAQRARCRYVISVEPVESVPVKCIAVDSPNHLYLAGNGMIPTHNTYDAGDLAEEMLKAGIPIVVIDGMGIWWGIRVGVEGHKGLPVVVFGGQHKDLALPMKRLDRVRETLDEERMRLMVKAILEARISAILDTSELSKGMQRRVVATFVNELNRLNANFGVRHVFIEEADMWCPQRGLTGSVAVSAGAIDDLVRRGGNWNLGCTLITQRSAVLNKDVLTQANCLIVLRILHAIDKKAVRTWVESVANPKDPKIAKWYDSLRELENGEAYVWHPEKPEIFKRVMFRKRETLHATREYFRQTSTKKQAEALDVTEFIEKFKNVFEPKPHPRVIAIREEPPKPVSVVHVQVIPPAIPGGPERLQETRIQADTPAYHYIPQDTIEKRDTIDLDPETKRDLVGRPAPIVDPDIQDKITVELTLPEIELVKTRPILQVPDEPSTPLGRVLVVLMNWLGRPDKRWTRSQIEISVMNHQWPGDGVAEAVNQLVRWEFLTPVQSGARTDYLFTGRDRVHILISNVGMKID